MLESQKRANKRYRLKQRLKKNLENREKIIKEMREKNISYEINEMQKNEN
jgi:hypothetical protein